MPKGVPKSGKRATRPATAGSFKKGEAKADPRRNNAGQRSAAVVSFNREIRCIISEVGNEEIETRGQKLSRIEGAVRGMYQAATKGNVQAFNALIERVEGKVTQPIEALLKSVDLKKLSYEQLERLSNGEDLFTVLISGAHLDTSDGGTGEAA